LKRLKSFVPQNHRAKATVLMRNRRPRRQELFRAGQKVKWKIESDPEMRTTHFDIFMKAFASLDEDSRLLAGDYILCPPSDDYGYEDTPKNALTLDI
jgi:hypothetical protein